MKKNSYPAKRTLNLYYKPDRTTKPATAALYVLLVLTILLGLSKLLVYDLWVETRETEDRLAAAQHQLASVMEELADFDQVRERYSRYSATEEERTLVDRMEVLALLDSAVGAAARMDSVTISADVVQVQFSEVTLAQTAEIVKVLEASPIVEGTVVNTASTTQNAADLVQANVRIQLRKEEAGR